MRIIALLVATLAALSTTTIESGCTSAQVTADKALFKAIAECAKTNNENATVVSSTVTCIESVSANDAAACLSILTPLSTWGKDELLCVAQAATATKTSMATSTATSTSTTPK